MDQILENASLTKATGLLPLHETLIQSFPRLEEAVIEKLSKDKKIEETRLEIKKIIQDIISGQENSNNSYPEYAVKTTQAIRELCNNNSLFYDDLPNNWENYLFESLHEILVPMKNKDYLEKLFSIAVSYIKRGEKVKFHKILDGLTDNASGKYEINKILTELKEGYGIDFIKIGGSGCVLKIEKVTQGKNNINENLENIKLIIEYNKDPSGVILNQILDIFNLFIQDILSHRKTPRFTQDEFIKFASEKLAFLTLSTIRNFTKELYNRFQDQGIILEKIKGTNTSLFHFHTEIYNIFLSKYFPDLEKYSEILPRLQSVLKQLELGETETIRIFIDYFVKNTKEKRFFNIREFLHDENLGENIKQKINTVLGLLSKRSIVGKYGKDKYYLQPYSEENDTISLMEQIKILQAQVSSEQEKNLKLENENRNLKLFLGEIQQENELITKDIHDLQRQKDSTEKDITIKRLAEELGNLRIQIEKLEEKIKSKDNSINRIRNIAYYRGKVIAKLECTINEGNQYTQTTEQSVNQDVTITNLHKEILTLQTQIKEMEITISMQEKQIKGLEASLIKKELPNKKTEVTPEKKQKKRLTKKEIESQKEEQIKIKESQITTIEHECVLKGFTIHGILTPKYYNILKKIFETLVELSKTSMRINEVIKIQTSREKIEIILDQKYQKYQNQINFVTQEIEEKNNLFIYISFV